VGYVFFVPWKKHQQKPMGFNTAINAHRSGCDVGKAGADELCAIAQQKFASTGLRWWRPLDDPSVLAAGWISLGEFSLKPEGF